MSMRERIARALFDVRDDEFDTDEWEDLDAVGRERWLCYADAISAEFYITVKPVTDRTIRSDDDEFAPGECDGSNKCTAPIHVHGCYTPHRSDQCDSPDEYGHTDRTNRSEEQSNG